MFAHVNVPVHLEIRKRKDTVYTLWWTYRYDEHAQKVTVLRSGRVINDKLSYDFIDKNKYANKYTSVQGRPLTITKMYPRIDFDGQQKYFDKMIQEKADEIVKKKEEEQKVIKAQKEKSRRMRKRFGDCVPDVILRKIMDERESMKKARREKKASLALAKSKIAIESYGARILDTLPLPLEIVPKE
jgi:hypothetical protein